MNEIKVKNPSTGIWETVMYVPEVMSALVDIMVRNNETVMGTGYIRVTKLI